MDEALITAPELSNKFIETASTSQQFNTQYVDDPWQFLIRYIILFIIFSTIVYAGVEFIKSIYGMISKKELSGKALKLMNFSLSYIYAWIFKFNLITFLLQLSTNSAKQTINEHANYFIISTLIYVGARKIWQHVSQYKNIKQEFSNGFKEKC